MVETPEKMSRTVWVGITLVMLLVAGAVLLSRLERNAPLRLPVIGPVADFSLTNQLGQAVTLADLRGQVWVADIIFTRCAGPCPRMTKQMAALQANLPIGSRTRLITLTTDPDFDTPQVLQRYAAKFGANAKRWWFLTGTKTNLAALAIDSLKLTTVEKTPAERAEPADLFIHSTIFVLVDKQGRLRASFQTGGDGVEWAESQAAILNAINILENEP